MAKKIINQITGWVSLCLGILIIIGVIGATLENEWSIPYPSFLELLLEYTIAIIMVYVAYLTYIITRNKRTIYYYNSIGLLLLLIVGSIIDIIDLIFFNYELTLNNLIYMKISIISIIILPIMLIINSIPLISGIKVSSLKKARIFSLKVILVSLIVFVIAFFFHWDNLYYPILVGVLLFLTGVMILVTTFGYQLASKINKFLS